MESVDYIVVGAGSLSLVLRAVQTKGGGAAWGAWET